MLELRGVRHRYDGRVVLDLAQFTIPRTGAVAVVGHNGAGKSTLLRLLALLEAPTEGQVLFNGTAVPRRAPAALRRRVTLVEQRPVLFRGTVRENLEYGLRVRDIGHTAASANRASRATVHAVRHDPAPSVSAVRRMRASTP